MPANTGPSEMIRSTIHCNSAPTATFPDSDVFNMYMRIHLTAVATISAVALLIPAVASATKIELGEMDASVTATCPTNCQAVSRVTGYQTLAGLLPPKDGKSGSPRKDLFVAPGEGRIVSITLKLGKPNKAQLAFFTERLGAASQVRVAIIKPKYKRNNDDRNVLNAQSDLIELNQYFGKTVEIPLKTSLLVRKGYIVALTIPTWAPVLAAGTGYDNTFAWRASRGKPCADTMTQAAQELAGSFTQYFCQYRTARLTYSATMISTP